MNKKKKRPKKELTRNEAVEMMHANTALAFRQTAKALKILQLDNVQTVKYLNELADELEAQSLTVSLRDMLGYEQPIGKE